MTTRGRKMLAVVERWGGAGMGTIELMIQSGYYADSEDGPGAVGRMEGAFWSVVHGLQRRGLVVAYPDGIEITEKGREASPGGDVMTEYQRDRLRRVARLGVLGALDVLEEALEEASPQEAEVLNDAIALLEEGEEKISRALQMGARTLGLSCDCGARQSFAGDDDVERLDAARRAGWTSAANEASPSGEERGYCPKCLATFRDLKLGGD